MFIAHTFHVKAILRQQPNAQIKPHEQAARGTSNYSLTVDASQAENPPLVRVGLIHLSGGPTKRP